MRRTTKAIAAMLMLALPTRISLADEADFKELWRWLCSSSGFYEMTVLPDGSYQPQTDFTDCCGGKTVEISVGELSKDARARCGLDAQHELAQPLLTYVVQIRGHAGAHDFGEDPCRQMVEVQQHTGPVGSLVGRVRGQGDQPYVHRLSQVYVIAHSPSRYRLALCHQQHRPQD